MRNSSLTHHAETRLHERCKLTSQELKALLDNGACIHVALVKGTRQALHLVYSQPDDSWFVVVQDAGDGGVLTLMPLDYLKDQISVTAKQRRAAKSKACAFLKSSEAPKAGPAAVAGTTKILAEPMLASPPATNGTRPSEGWKLRVCCTKNGVTHHRNLPTTPTEYGGPDDWAIPGLIHDWLRERLIDAGIPFKSIERIGAERGGKFHSVDFLLEHLPLSQDEILACR